jgi:hypothetical protein
MNSQLDFATLALKGKRYAEAESIFMSFVGTEKAVEAWCGIGLCKLYQLTERCTMEEVIFCFDKAKELNPALSKEIEDQLIIHSQIVLTAYVALIDGLVQKAAKEKKKASWGVVLAGASMLAGMNSKSTFGTLASLAGTGAGAGITLDSLNRLGDLKEASQIIIGKCDEIYNGVKLFCSPNSESALQLEENVKTVQRNLEVLVNPDGDKKNREPMEEEATKLYGIFIFLSMALSVVYGYVNDSIGTGFTAFFVLVVFFAVVSAGYDSYLKKKNKQG